MNIQGSPVKSERKTMKGGPSLVSMWPPPLTPGFSVGLGSGSGSGSKGILGRSGMGILRSGLGVMMGISVMSGSLRSGMGMTTSGLGVMIGFSVMSGSLRSGMGTTTSGLVVMEGITGILGRSGMGMSGRSGRGRSGRGRSGRGRSGKPGRSNALAVCGSVAAAIRVTSSSKDRNTLSGFMVLLLSWSTGGRLEPAWLARRTRARKSPPNKPHPMCQQSSCPSELVKRQGSAVMVLLEWQVCVNLVDLVCM